jgi:hypothetical protein
MDHKGENGEIITDEMLEKWGQDAERGIYHGTPGKLITRKQFGRPKIYDEPMVSVSVRLPASEVEQAKRAAQREGVPFPTFVRKVFKEGLEGAGVEGD